MPYVQRTESGRIFGQFANLQPGFAEEWIEEGSPELSPIDPEQLAVDERVWRDGELVAVMWLRERHRDQLEIEAPTTLTGAQFKELLVYLQALRDWPQSPDFPVAAKRPVAPPWIAEQPK
ncbi:phage tail assembly chaperone [Pseudomonas protegens]|uniref:phage tail assembly chaperone n=1 Tax=Pseudomonas protegens TaxID=380021 RepID=UPI002282C158|nr:phage tail assembly chaperone [Pseudomonas protegens]MCY7262713.1 phage tail assembly chaperone [Pseudomonas protegens]